jgi:hypothetical protein
MDAMFSANWVLVFNWKRSLSARGVAMKKWLTVLCLLMVITSGSSSTQAQSDDSLARLEPLQGLVQALPAEETDWQLVLEPISVKEGDQIRTGAYGLARLSFLDKTFSGILTNTIVTIQTLQLPNGEEDVFHIVLEQPIGDTYTRVSTILDKEVRFEIVMPGMTAGSSDALWQSRVTPTGHSMVFVQAGSVATAGILNPDNPVMVSPNEFIAYRLDGSLDETLQPVFPAPQPAQVGLPPDTCGNQTCEFGEFGTCELDCPRELPTCGNNLCEADEGLLICQADCSSILDLNLKEQDVRLEGQTNP